jgi:hypothetical protein
VLLELYCLEEEEEGFDPPTLRVQAPLYRRGPGYSTSSGCPATGSPVTAALAWGLLGAVGGGRAWLASIRSLASIDLVGTLQPLIKHQLKVLSSSPARAFSGEDVSRLLAQPAPWLKSTSLAGCRGDPWDISR